MKSFLKLCIGCVCTILIIASCTKEQLDKFSEIHEINKERKKNPFKPIINPIPPKPNQPTVVIVNTPKPEPKTTITIQIENEQPILERLYVNGDITNYNIGSTYSIVINEKDLGSTANYGFYDVCGNSFEGTFKLLKESRIKLSEKLYKGILNFTNTSNNPYNVIVAGKTYEIPGKSTRYLEVYGYTNYNVKWQQKSGYALYPTQGQTSVWLSCDNKEENISFP